ncbi:MAG: pentapeptide repeat-containing protein [Ktedonobacteraceae bacterium]
MANWEQIELLKQGVSKWNEWRAKNQMVDVDLRIAELQGMDLRGADLRMADLSGANLSRANLSGAQLSLAILNEANLEEADLGIPNIDSDDGFEGANLSSSDVRKANLRKARLVCANLSWADLSGANLEEANLEEANLGIANLSGAILQKAHLLRTDLYNTNLSRADLREAQISHLILIDTDLREANLTGCRINSVVDAHAQWRGSQDYDLIVTYKSQPTIIVDGFAMSLLIQLLLRDRSLWGVIERVTARVGLILALCIDERKKVINVLKSELRKLGYVPITFDCEQIEKREYKDWLDILTRLAKFVIIDMTAAKDIAQELPFLVSQHPSVPIQPVVQSSADDSIIPEELAASPSVLETYHYQQVEDIQRDASALIARAEQKAQELAGR